MEAICLSGKPPEIIGSFIGALLKPRVKSMFFNEKVTDREVVNLLYLPSTVFYGLYKEDQAGPMGVVFFCNVLPHENSSLYMALFEEADGKQALSTNMYNFIKKDLLTKCPTLNSIETVVIENPNLEKALLQLGFKKIGTRKHYKCIHHGERYLDVSNFYYLCEED